jgi:cysteine-rich repeat protein
LDGCDATCHQEYGWSCLPTTPYAFTNCSQVCGNAIKTAGEACDDGNTISNDGCSSDCKQIENGYNCTILPSGRSDCRKLCGNGIKTPEEECDDGNYISDDGCNQLCKIETGWKCNTSMPRSVCTVVCGDGRVVIGREACDDGNAKSGDGCSNDCKAIEHGFTCTGGSINTASVCTWRCGDGLISSKETCDDANTVPTSGDGCSSTCQIESGWSCVGEPSVCG